MKKIFLAFFILVLIIIYHPVIQAQVYDDIKFFYIESDKLIDMSTQPPFAGAVSRGTFKQVRINVLDVIADMRTADLNKDGITDIIIMDEDAKLIRVYMGDKGLLFKKKFKYNFAQLGNRFIGIADLDGNGKLDVAVENNTPGKPVSIFMGKGNGKLIKKHIPLAVTKDRLVQITYASITDINGDGDPDILVSDAGYNFFAFINQGNVKFTSNTFSIDKSYGFTAGDFDGDNWADLYSYELFANTIIYYKGNGDGSFIKKHSHPVEDTGGSCDLYAAYINKDKNLDVLGQGNLSGDRKNWVYMGKGNGKLTKKKYLPGDGYIKNGAVLTDISGNNKTDLAAAESDGIYYYTGTGTGKFNSPLVLGNGLDFADGGYGDLYIQCGDFNKDGKIDIVGNNKFTTLSNLIFFLNGLTPAKLKISKLKTSTLELQGNKIYFKGSVNYSGSNCVFKYLSKENNPFKSAYLQFRVKIDLAPKYNDMYVTYYVTGRFLNNLNPNAGIINFDLELSSPVTVISGTPPPVTMQYFSLYDFNLVRSNLIE